MRRTARPRALNATLAAMLATALTVLLSCHSQSGSGDSSSHWLSPCSRNGDCGALECVCGVCTRRCSAMASCSDLSPTAECAPLDAPNCAETSPVCIRGRTTAADGGNDGPDGGNDGPLNMDAAGTGDAVAACTGVDTNSDPENCGACGTVCGPTRIGDGESFAIDATNVYWTNFGDGTVMKAPLAGGAPTTLASGQRFDASFAVDATHVYWVNVDSGPSDDVIMKVPLAGGSSVALTSVGYPLIARFVLTQTAVVFGVGGCATGGGVQCGGPYRSIVQVPLTGGTPLELSHMDIPSDNNALGFGPFVFVVVGSSVVWVDYQCTGLDAGEPRCIGTIVKSPLSGGTPVTLVSGVSAVTSIAADASNVYWLEDGQCLGADGGADGGCGLGTLKSAPIAGGNPVTLSSDIPSDPTPWPEVRHALVVDATSVYTVTNYSNGDGAITKVPLAGGSPVTIASRQARMSTYAFDATNAYWINAAPSGIVGARAQVMKAPLSGGAPVVLASLVPREGAWFSGMIVDSTSIYWTNEISNIVKLPLGGIACQNGVCQ